MKNDLNKTTVISGVTVITESWDEVSFEELEERLELDKCTKFNCNFYGTKSS